MSNSCEIIGVNGKTLHKILNFFYYKSHKNLYQYYMSHENLYQVLQAVHATSECAIKLEAHMIKSLFPHNQTILEKI